MGAARRSADPPAVALGRFAAFLGVSLLVVGCGLRLLYLDADPHYYGYWGHFIDEGRWTQQARSMVLRGSPFEDGSSPNMLVAPGFEGASYVAFAIGGVSRISARLFPVVCGTAMLALLFAYLRRRASPSGTALGMALVAFQADVFVLSRVASPEVPAMAFSLAAFVALTAQAPTTGRLALGGALTAVMVAIKATTLPLVAIFALVTFTLREGATARRRWRDLGAYGLGLAAVAVPSACALWFVVGELGDASGLAARLGTLVRRFVGFRDAYIAARLPFVGTTAAVMNTPALALWAAALARLGGPSPDPAARRGMRAAVLWALLYIGAMLLNTYFPPRYVIHLLLPLAVIAALAATRLEAVGASGVARGIASATGRDRVFAIGVLCLPSAALLAPALVALLGAAGAPTERLSLRLLTLIGTWLALGRAAAPFVREPRAVSLLMGFPLIAAVAWFVAWVTASVQPRFWIESEFIRSGTLWAGFLALAAGATLVAVRWIRSTERRSWIALSISCALTVAWAAHLAPGFLAPRYTARDGSRDLGALLAEADVVLQHHADGFFLDNQLRYRWIWSAGPGSEKVHWTKTPHEYLLTRLPFKGDPRYLAREYELMRGFVLYASSTRWPHPAPSPACPGARGLCIGLFRKSPPLPRMDPGLQP